MPTLSTPSPSTQSPLATVTLTSLSFARTLRVSTPPCHTRPFPASSRPSRSAPEPTQSELPSTLSSMPPRFGLYNFCLFNVVFDCPTNKSGAASGSPVSTRPTSWRRVTASSERFAPKSPSATPTSSTTTSLSITVPCSSSQNPTSSTSWSCQTCTETSSPTVSSAFKESRN